MMTQPVRPNIPRLEKLKSGLNDQLNRISLENDGNRFYTMLLPFIMMRLRVIAISSSQPRQDVLNLLKAVDALTMRKAQMKVKTD